MEVFPPPLASMGMEPMPNPDWGLTNEPDADVIASKLGDGYVFREPAGINWIKEGWSLTWSSMDPASGNYVYRWLKQRLKLVPFLWVHPVTNETFQVTVTSTRLTFDVYNNAVLEASFEQDFNPGA